MTDRPPMPDFPSRRSLHGAGADPYALERAIEEVREAMTGLIPKVTRHPHPEDTPSEQQVPTVAPAPVEEPSIAPEPAPEPETAQPTELDPAAESSPEAPSVPQSDTLPEADAADPAEPASHTEPASLSEEPDAEVASTAPTSGWVPAWRSLRSHRETTRPTPKVEAPGEETTGDDQARTEILGRADSAGTDSPASTTGSSSSRASSGSAASSAPTPKRRSFKERFAALENKTAQPDPPVPPTPSLGVPVGAGELSAPGDSFTNALTGAYSIITEGSFDPALTDTGLVPVVEVVEAGEPLTLEQAKTHHLFLVPDDVLSSEIEALAVSIWDEAAWAMPGTLRLVGEAYLRGPWRVDPEMAGELGIAPHLTRAWLLETPRVRALPSPPPTDGENGQGIPGAPAVHDPWAVAFPNGLPLGLEYKALLALIRMARRLGGALRICGSGHVMSPAMESAVHMAVYAPRWVMPEELLGVVKEHYPQAIDSREVTLSAPLPPAPHEVRRVKSVLAGIKPLSPDIERVLKKAREEAARQPQRVDGYALMIDVPDNGTVYIEVHRVMRPPRVLRWEAWTSGAIVEYSVRWTPVTGMHDLIALTDNNPSAERLENSAKAAAITEHLAIILSQVTGGTVVDEDGFLVAVD